MEDTNLAIWPLHEAFYIHSMLFNTRCAVGSISLLGDIVEHIEANGYAALDDIDTEDVLNHLQNIILQGASLSRYFWPVRKGHEKRAKKLRSSLAVEEDNPLRSRDLRNAMEHFDERLDGYLSTGIVGTIIPQYFGLNPQNDGVPRHMFRAYYVDLGVFELLGEQFQIEPIAKEIWRLNGELENCHKNGDRLPGSCHAGTRC